MFVQRASTITSVAFLLSHNKPISIKFKRVIQVSAFKPNPLMCKLVQDQIEGDRKKDPGFISSVDSAINFQYT